MVAIDETVANWEVLKWLLLLWNFNRFIWRLFWQWDTTRQWGLFVVGLGKPSNLLCASCKCRFYLWCQTTACFCLCTLPWLRVETWHGNVERLFCLCKDPERCGTLYCTCLLFGIQTASEVCIFNLVHCSFLSSLLKHFALLGDWAWVGMKEICFCSLRLGKFVYTCM